MEEGKGVLRLARSNAVPGAPAPQKAIRVGGTFCSLKEPKEESIEWSRRGARGPGNAGAAVGKQAPASNRQLFREHCRTPLSLQKPLQIAVLARGGALSPLGTAATTWCKSQMRWVREQGWRLQATGARGHPLTDGRKTNTASRGGLGNGWLQGVAFPTTELCVAGTLVAWTRQSSAAGACSTTSLHFSMKCQYEHARWGEA